MIGEGERRIGERSRAHWLGNNLYQCKRTVWNRWSLGFGEWVAAAHEWNDVLGL